MFIESVCPDCGTTLQVQESLENSTVRCGECQSTFVAIRSEPTDYTPVARAKRKRVQDDTEEHAGKAPASLVLGGLGLVGWCLPIIGFPMTLTGLILGIKSMHTRNHSQAVIGITLNVIGLILSVANAAIGAYLGATGQHPMLK
ncbi:MAG: hypothetical protein C0467_02005 [Planctomycetaceae bacterium]|nr:hypothetical protein [Planctomycetaceae bacterium]